MRSMLSNPRSPLRLIRNVLGDPTGATAVIIALALSAIVGFAGLGTETEMLPLCVPGMRRCGTGARSVTSRNFAKSALKMNSSWRTCDELQVARSRAVQPL